MKNLSVLGIASIALTIALPLAGNAAPAPAVHVRGTVAAVSGNRVTVTTANGPVVIILGPKTRFAGVVPGSVGDIEDGTFIGTANVPGAGAARALEVVVFPPAMKGTGEGDYPWDLPAGSASTSAMTNGTVMKRKMSAMTNATVTNVGNGPVKTVSLSYKGGTKSVAIAPGTPIVKVVPGTRALVVAGAHVFVAPGPTAAGAVIVGEMGAVPPM